MKTNYEDINLKRMKFDRKTEFWFSNKKIISFESKSPKTSTGKGICHHIEIFKKNFLLIFKDDCWAAGPASVKRDNVLVLDLNTKKVYNTDFGNIQLSMSKSYNDYCCENSKNSFAILYIDLEIEEIIIHNKFGSESFKMTPYYKSVF
ncbi:hypothetical protein [Winogradskyella sp. PE311]|uniref:hypothetical protein n=1 Tax=Winogradskyella sp. PE311 TaxID=3366943 RepID=UPI003980DB66